MTKCGFDDIQSWASMQMCRTHSGKRPNQIKTAKEAAEKQIQT